MNYFHKLIIILVIYIILMVVTRKRKNLLCYGIEIAIIFIGYYFYDFPELMRDTFSSSFFVYVVIGYFISPVILVFTYYLVFRKIPKLHLTVTFSWEMLLGVIEEEIIWRNTVFMLLYRSEFEFLFSAFIVIMFNSLFIFSHPKEKVETYNDMIEMFLFSMILSMVGLLCNGSNFGVHLGRNAVCSVKGVGRNEKDTN